MAESVFGCPTVHAVPSGVHLAILPPFGHLLVREFSGYRKMRALVWSVEHALALIASVSRPVACVVQPCVKDDIRDPLDDVLWVSSGLGLLGGRSARAGEFSACPGGQDDRCERFPEALDVLRECEEGLRRGPTSGRSRWSTTSGWLSVPG